MKTKILLLLAALGMSVLLTACPDSKNKNTSKNRVKSIVYDYPESIKMTLNFFHNPDGSIAEIQQISQYYDFITGEPDDPDTLHFLYRPYKDSLEIRLPIGDLLGFKATDPNDNGRRNGNLYQKLKMPKSENGNLDELYLSFHCKLNTDGYITSVHAPLLFTTLLSLRYDNGYIVEYNEFDEGDSYPLANFSWENGNPKKIEIENYLVLDLQYGENPRTNTSGIDPVLLMLEIEEYVFGMPLAAAKRLGKPSRNLPQSMTYNSTRKEIFTYDFDGEKLLKIKTTFIDNGTESPGRSIEFKY